MKLIVVEIELINSWERLAMTINNETRTSISDKYPQVEFIIGNSHTSQDLAELQTKVKDRMAEIEVFGKATKKWLRFSNRLEVFAIIKWPSQYTVIEFACTPESFGVQIDIINEPNIQLLNHFA